MRTGASIVGLGIGAVLAASAALGQSLPTAPAAQSFKVGALPVSVLRDGRLAIPNDGSVFGLNASAKQVSALLRRAGAAEDKIMLDIDVLLVRTRGRVALIDAGYGPKGKGVLRQSLELLHVSPGEVTDILITHAHPDHVGGLVDEAGHPTFPHATIHMSAREWRFMQREAGTREIAAAVRTHVRTFTPGSAVLPGIRSLPLPGHTPGHVMYELSSDGQRLLDTGDTVHSSIVSLAKPGWTLAWDGDKTLAARQRIAELGRLAASHERIFAVHFPFPGTGFIARRAGRFVFVGALPDKDSR